MILAFRRLMLVSALVVAVPVLAVAADDEKGASSASAPAAASDAAPDAGTDSANKTEPHPGVFVGEPKAAAADANSDAGAEADAGTYDQESMLHEADKLFGNGAKGLADVIAKAFEDNGRPNGFIVGEEAGAAIGVGLRYGKGTLKLKKGGMRTVYWQAPSIGFDAGGNAAKTLVLVYNLPSIEKVYQRYPGIDGSVYVVGGIGVNYNQRDDIVLAPIRVGVGWRVGASVGYLKVTPTKTFNPF